jgi:isoleucyl-tRNA synthetase
MATKKEGNKYSEAVMRSIYRINAVVPFVRLDVDQFIGDKSIIMSNAGCLLMELYALLGNDQILKDKPSEYFVCNLHNVMERVKFLLDTVKSIYLDVAQDSFYENIKIEENKKMQEFCHLFYSYENLETPIQNIGDFLNDL